MGEIPIRTAWEPDSENCAVADVDTEHSSATRNAFLNRYGAHAFKTGVVKF